MKNKSKIWRLMAALAITLAASACSDGELKFDTSPLLTPPLPNIVIFKADPAQVEAGGSTTLSWIVEEADNIEIGVNPEAVFQFHLPPFEELTGSTVVDNITATTEFVLTASKTVLMPVSGTEGGEPAVNPEAPPAAFIINKSGQIQLPEQPVVPDLVPQTVSATATTQVTVVESGLSADITADKSVIMAGETTAIRWTVTPSTATATVRASDGTPVVSAADCVRVTGTVEGYPVVGCSSVTPEATTTYTLTGTDSNGRTATDAVTIEVRGANVEANIYIVDDGEDKKNAIVNSFAEPVEVRWEADPENALVTVSADKPVDCTPELPVDEESASGSAMCTLTDNTTFTIRAQLGEAEDTDNANVMIMANEPIPLDVEVNSCDKNSWAFESETVNVKVKAKNEGDAGAIANIKIGDQNLKGSDVIDWKEVQVKVTDARGIIIEVTRVGATVPDIKLTPLYVMQVNPQHFFHAADGERGPDLEVSKILVDSNNPNRFYFGAKRDEFGEISLFKINDNSVDGESASEFSIAVGDPMKDAFDIGDGWINDTFFSERSYPITAIAVRGGNDDQMFVATTGAIMYTEDGGEKWKTKDTLTMFYSRRTGYDGSACSDEMQTATSVATNSGEDGDLVALGQACDLILKGKNLISAETKGIFVQPDVDAYLTSGSSRWVAATGADTIAYDLEEAGDTAIFAATKLGVLKNDTGDGKSWTAFAGGVLDGSKPVYAVAFDSKAGKIYAGADDGVYVSAADTANWEKTGEGEGALNEKVLSLTVDPYYPCEPVIIAGTATGAAVTRDGGKFWSKLDASEVPAEKIKSVALSAKFDGSDVTYIAAVSGSKAAPGGHVKVPVMSGGSDSGGDEEEGETPGETPGEGDGDGTVNPGGEGGEGAGGGTGGLSISSIFSRLTNWVSSLSI